ncbi:ATP11 protein-domain-containing protein [Abortiporus biennis]|nr:ATP11 protein-domain-containing protein [Abortiporus biennis]
MSRQGISVEELKEQIRLKEQKEREIKRAKELKKELERRAEENSLDTSQSQKNRLQQGTYQYVPRKDSSPVKPLSNILNLERLLQTPHTPEQVSVLWRAYHAAKSGGTGRGYLCATIPVATYEKMLETAKRYPSFVLPVPRENAQIGEDQKPADSKTVPAEFFFLQWGFHEAPPEPIPETELFSKPKPSSNPPISTILFTSLQEYKSRTTFATPYLVMTHYTDLASTHGLVLLRGEITPSAADPTKAGADERYLLSQQDAQLLAMGVQKFYLWTDEQSERQELLKRFHDTPDAFEWADILKHIEFAS